MDLVALADTPEDIAYVTAGYIDAASVAQGRCTVESVLALAGTQLPAASYRLPDGSLWFARDWWRLHDDAGDPAAIRALFARRHRAAARALGFAGDVDGDWAAYLAGQFGVCLRDVTPETIVWKEWLVARLGAALADPRPDDPRWLADTGADIAMLDGLERPFASCDRARFGGTTSRERLITTARARYPGLV